MTWHLFVDKDGHDNKKGDNATQATLTSRPTGRISEINVAGSRQGVKGLSFHGITLGVCPTWPGGVGDDTPSREGIAI